MAIASVNRAENTVLSGFVTNVNTAAASHTTGNLLVVYVVVNSTNAAITITDTAANTWTQVGGARGAFQFGTGTLRMFYAYNITGHATNVINAALTSASSQYMVCSVRQFSGFGSTNPLLDRYGGWQATSSTSITLGTTLNVTAESVIVVGLAGGGGTASAGSGYTITQFTGTDGQYWADEYKIVTANETPSGGFSTSGSLIGICSVFTPTPGSGGGGGGGSFAFVS